MDKLMATSWSGYLPYALLVFLILGLGLFIRNRLLKITQSDPQLEDLLAANSSSKRSSFKEMADAYRNRQEDTADDEQSNQLNTVNNRKADVKDVIGLHSLNQSDLEAEEKPVPARSVTPPTSAVTTPKTPAPGVSLEQLLAAMQKAQTTSSEKPRRGVNPYIPPQANPTAASKVKVPANKARTNKPAALTETTGTIEWPVAEANAPINRAMIAKKSNTISTPATSGAVTSATASKNASKSLLGNTQQGPLPGNPEVLNFLRNVADLMEKDGKTDIAQNIHKNLNSQNVGLAR